MFAVMLMHLANFVVLAAGSCCCIHDCWCHRLPDPLVNNIICAKMVANTVLFVHWEGLSYVWLQVTTRFSKIYSFVWNKITTSLLLARIERIIVFIFSTWNSNFELIFKFDLLRSYLMDHSPQDPIHQDQDPKRMILLSHSGVVVHPVTKKPLYLDLSPLIAR